MNKKFVQRIVFWKNGKDSSAGKVTLLVLLFMPFILYMQYSKFRWKIVAQPMEVDFLMTVFHAEMSLFFVSAFLMILLPGLRRFVFILFTLLYYIAFIDSMAWFSVDRPFLPTDLYDTIEFIIYYPEFLFQPGGPANFKTIFLAMLPPGVKVIQVVLSRLASKEKIYTLTSAVFAGVIAVFLVSSFFLVSPGYFKLNTLIRIAAEIEYDSYVSKVSVDKTSFFGRPKERSFSRSTSSDALTGKTNSPNIILFVIETAPDMFYPDLSDYFKNNNREEVARITERFSEHYSPMPQSDRAIYSILSGMYPPIDNGNGWIMVSGIYSHSLPKMIKKYGYVSHFISTAPLDFHNNREMLEGLGFDMVYETEIAKAARINKNGIISWNRSLLYTADEALLKKATSIITDNSQTSSKPFLLVLAPQASHAPFQKPPGAKSESMDDEELLRENAYWQFDLIKQLIDCLKQTDQLRKSIILVTGDHGIRNQAETKQLLKNQQLLNVVTFKVPLWIITGEDVENPIEIPKLATSHIDITPSLLDMLGVSFDPNDYHGRSVFSQIERPIFFFGGVTLPVSGYKESGCYFMENRHLDLLEANSVFDFETNATPEEHNLGESTNPCRELPGVEMRIARKMRSVNNLLKARNF